MEPENVAQVKVSARTSFFLLFELKCCWRCVLSPQRPSSSFLPSFSCGIAEVAGRRQQVRKQAQAGAWCPHVSQPSSVIQSKSSGNASGKGR